MNMRGHPIFGVVLSTLFILVVTIWPLVKVGPLEWAIHGSQLVLLSLLLVSMPIHTIRAPRDAAIIPRWLHWGILISFLAFFVLFPFAAGSYLYWRHIAIVAGITIIAVLGLNVLVGLCGEISLAQGAFIGMGAFVSGTLATTLALPFGIALSAATLLTALVGLILGLSCIRLTGLWLAFATLVAQFVIFFAINRMLPGLLGGKRELMIPASLMPERVPFFLVVATLMIMTIVLVELLARFKIGVRTTLARDDQSTNGTSNPRILGFVVSSFCAGLAGSLSMYFYGGMIPELFPWTYAVYSLWCLGIVIIGGPGTILGVIGAVMIFFQYQEGFRPVTTLGMSFQQGLLGCSIVLLLFSYRWFFGLISQRVRPTRKSVTTIQSRPRPFASGHLLAQWLTTLLAALMLSHVVGALALLSWQPQDPGGAIARVQQLTFLVSGLFFLFWLHRVYCNLPALGTDLFGSPGWVVGCWFVPIVNLIAPYVIMRDICTASDPGADLGDLSPLHSRTPPVRIRWWWGFVVTAGIMKWFAAAVVRAGGLGILGKDVTAAAVVASTAASVAAAALSIAVIRAIDQGQQARSMRRGG